MSLWHCLIGMVLCAIQEVLIPFGSETFTIGYQGIARQAYFEQVRQANRRAIMQGLADLRSASQIQHALTSMVTQDSPYFPTVWNSPQALNVHTRCTVINYLNGPVGASQTCPASELPHDFYENFDAVCIWVL